MKVTEKKGSSDKIILEAVASTEEVGRALDAAHFAFAQQMNLQPERDKTVAQVAEEKLGVKNLDALVQNQAIEFLVPYAIDKKNIIPSYPPQAQSVSAFRRGQTCSFTLEVSVKPCYELDSYEPVSIKVPEFVPNLEEVEAQLSQMAETYAEYVADDPRLVEKGDSCLIALEASTNGEPMAGLSTEGRTYTTGAGLMPDGFDEAIVGMNVGETKSFSFDGPGLDEEGSEIAEVVDCVVTVKEMQKKVIPEIDDEWVKKFMPMYKDEASLRQLLVDEVSKGQKLQYDEYVRQQAASALARRFKGSIADEVYEVMSKEMMKNLREQLTAQGVTVEQFVEEQGGEQQFNMMMMMQTRQSLVQGYVLDSVFRHEGLKITDEDIDRACQTIDPQNAKMLRQQMEQTGRNFVLRELAERMCASEFVIAHAEIETIAV